MYVLLAVGALTIATAMALGFVLALSLVFPRLSALECLAAAAPVGLTLSAWLALLLKSTLFQQ
jgi:hypothetical protein